jgi:predicted SprT family Zn-dependent metalloprotease
MNRETWLLKGVEELKKSVFQPVGLKVPKVNVSVSLMSTGIRKQKNATLGENYHTRCSTAGNHEIFMSPLYFDRSNSARVLDVLAHELIHAIDNNKHGHGKVFRDMALKIGLKSPMRATTANKELKEKCEKIVKKIGEFPHDKMIIDQNRKKQGTRMKKVSCLGCGFSYRTSQKNINMMTNNICNACGKEKLQSV